MVARALSVEPAHRGTAADFALDLRHAADPVAVELSAGHAQRAPRTPQPPLTYGVRAPAPFGDGPGGRHQAPPRRRRVPVGLAAAAVVLALSAAAALWWLVRPAHHDSAAAARATAVPVHATARRANTPPRATVSPVALPTAAAPPPVAAILTGLDRTRSRAYARRDPALLASVYDSSALLARDRAMLLTIVPAGCGLRGVRTRFTGMTVRSRTAGRLQLSVTEVLGSSTLVCDATASGRAASTGPVRLVVDLVRVGPGYRIAAQRSA